MLEGHIIGNWNVDLASGQVITVNGVSFASSQTTSGSIRNNASVPIAGAGLTSSGAATITFITAAATRFYRVSFIAELDYKPTWAD